MASHPYCNIFLTKKTLLHTENAFYYTSKLFFSSDCCCFGFDYFNEILRNENIIIIDKIQIPMFYTA